MQNIKKKKVADGFSLIELVVVVILIGIVAAITLPRLRRAVVAANEAGTVSAMRLIRDNEINKIITQGEVATIADLVSQNHIDNRFTPTDAGGYQTATGGFDYLLTPIINGANGDVDFILSCKPSNPTPVIGTGVRRFAVLKNGIILYDLENLDVHFTSMNDLGNALPIGN